MLDPDHKDIGCPKCLRRKVYFDRAIGYYCMFCGHELSIEESLFLIEKVTSTSESTHISGKGARMPIVEIKERRVRHGRTEHASPGSDITQQKKPD